MHSLKSCDQLTTRQLNYYNYMVLWPPVTSTIRNYFNDSRVQCAGVSCQPTWTESSRLEMQGIVATNCPENAAWDILRVNGPLETPLHLDFFRIKSKEKVVVECVKADSFQRLLTYVGRRRSTLIRISACLINFHLVSIALTLTEH